MLAVLFERLSLRVLLMCLAVFSSTGLVFFVTGWDSGVRPRSIGKLDALLLFSSIVLAGVCFFFFFPGFQFFFSDLFECLFPFLLFLFFLWGF